MTIGFTFRFSLIAALLLLVSACSSSDSDTPDSEVADNPNPQGPLVPGESPPQSDPVSEPAGDDDPAPADPDGETEPPVEGSGDQNPPANTPLEPPVAPGGGPADPISLLIPPVAAGSDLDRLIRGLTQQVSVTLLELNQLVFSGSELTELQNACLGSFEEGFGAALTEINCGESLLAAGGNTLRVGQAAFYETPECLSSLLNNSSEGCVLERVSLTVRPTWDTSALGRPTLLFRGAVLSYAIGDTSLHIDNDGEMLAGFFSCDIDLETLAITSEFDGSDCDNTVKIVTNEIEDLQTP